MSCHVLSHHTIPYHAIPPHSIPSRTARIFPSHVRARAQNRLTGAWIPWRRKWFSIIRWRSRLRDAFRRLDRVCWASTAPAACGRPCLLLLFITSYHVLPWREVPTLHLLCPFCLDCYSMYPLAKVFHKRWRSFEGNTRSGWGRGWYIARWVGRWVGGWVGREVGGWVGR